MSDGGPAFPCPVIRPEGITPLTTKERDVLQMRDSGMNLQQVGAAVKSTRERV